MRQFKIENIQVEVNESDLKLEVNHEEREYPQTLCRLYATDKEQLNNLINHFKNARKTMILDYILEELEQVDTDSNSVIIDDFDMIRFIQTFSKDEQREMLKYPTVKNAIIKDIKEELENYVKDDFRLFNIESVPTIKLDDNNEYRLYIEYKNDSLENIQTYFIETGLSNNPAYDLLQNSIEILLYENEALQEQIVKLAISVLEYSLNDIFLDDDNIIEFI
jgi:hypothetical protein